MKKSTRKVIAVILILAMCLGLAAALFTSSTPARDQIDGVYDQADLLDDSQERALTQRLEKYAGKYKSDIASVTTDNAGGLSSQAYADRYAENLGMSMQEDGYAGILFLIDMDNRMIYMSTSGQAIAYYSESRIDSVLDKCYSRIIDEDYQGTCDAFLDGVYRYMGISPRRGGRMTLFGIILRLIIALAAGAGITALMVHSSKGRVTAAAADYFDASDSKMLAKNDRFLNRTITRRVIRDNDDDHGGGFGGGGGGGGFHVSSGGAAHGGGGRSF